MFVGANPSADKKFLANSPELIFQGSRWTFQATRMNGDIGTYTIKPDQMSVVNPLLILILIPLFESVMYPSFKK